MSPLLSKEDMDAMNSGDESDHDLISTGISKDIRDGNQSHPKFNKREDRYKIRDRIRQMQSEWKGVLKAARNMGKGLHKVFKTVVKDTSQYFPPVGESGSEIYRFIPEPRNFAEVKKLSDDINKPWLKATLKEIKNLINNQTFLVEDTEKDEPVTICMDVYKSKIQSYRSLDKLKLRILVRRDL